uniref:Rubisco LSMT substrate-binding domain-containing protein n=1 Tax=Rhizochromulina marina TaxID=1034831 RepID=A0A7S2WNH5_9STRA
MSEEVLAEAQDPDLYAKGVERRQQLAARFEQLAPILSKLKELVEAESGGAQKPRRWPRFNLAWRGGDREATNHGGWEEEDFAWANAVLSSRALTFRGRRYLAPIVDFFNYQPHPQPRAAASGEFYLEHHQLGEENLLVLSDRATSSGGQVFEDYGDNSNSLYLDHHGFVPSENPFDCVHTTLRVDEEVDLASDRQAVLRRLRVPESPLVCFGSLASGELPWPAHVWLAALTMDEASLAACLEPRPSADACPIRFQNPVAGWQHPPTEVALLAGSVDAQIAAYPTSIQDDLAALTSPAGDALPYDQRLVIQYRLSQKRLLKQISLELAAFGAEAEAAVAVEADGQVVGARDAQAMEVEQVEEQAEKPGPAAMPTTTEPGTEQGRAPACDTIECMVEQFNAWVAAQDFPVNKIAAAVVPGMRVGTLATSEIAAEEPYLSVPSAVVMSVDSARQSAVLEPLLRVMSRQTREADFYALLFHLLYEFYVQREASFYWPYLQLLPQLEEIYPPVEFSEEDMRVLAGSTVADSVRQYKARVAKNWQLVQSVAEATAPVFDAVGGLTEEKFRWAHYILDSRSIWWSGQRHLVPLLDLINCQEMAYDPSRVHGTNLDDTGRFAVTLSPAPFQPGEQLFENYGQPNYIYFQYHGFVLEENTHDCVLVSIKIDEKDPGAADLGQLREAMRRMGFYSGVQSFCVSDRQGGHPGSNPRLAAWLALKSGKDMQSDVTEEFHEVLRNKLGQYPESTAGEGNPKVAMARKLVAKEKALLRGILEAGASS